MKNYELNERLKAIRIGCNKSQEAFAKKLGVSRITVQHYEEGTTTPSIETLKQYHKLGNVSWSYLLDDDEKDTSERQLITLVSSLSPIAQDKLLTFLQSIINK